MHYANRLEAGVDRVRKLSKDFCASLGLTLFGYVRIYHDGRMGWVTSNADQDRFLIDSGAIDEDPYVDNAKGLREGGYLWFNDRKFPGSDAFYRERARLFKVDHGLIVVKHSKEYLETCCFSGLLAKRPLYNLFMNEVALFEGFMDHFKNELDRPLLKLIEEGVLISDLKKSYGKPSGHLNPDERCRLVALCGDALLLKLSKREKECLQLFGKGLLYQEIAESLGLSARTVEHYLESVKNKLGFTSRSELVHHAQKIASYKLLS